jgi:hypothetical protein
LPRHFEPLGEPVEGGWSRANAPALDLADVLLGEAPEAELCLRQPARDAELADSLAEC